jgi:hypothetical protein
VATASSRLASELLQVVTVEIAVERSSNSVSEKKEEHPLFSDIEISDVMIRSTKNC